ncbi:hypothetical protein BFW01_g4931 [Lasiodiplodia theobromae]|nr:hypothetical protein BFW01_g4931 [Lasiodiplodia theobromae]
MPPNETREEAAVRFQAAFWEHQDERTPHNKNNPAGKKNTHKHLPTRAQLAEWVDALKDGTETQFASGQERHWAKTYLRLEGGDVFWKSSGNGGVPDMKVLCLEEWALRIFDAHVADEAVHRGRDATYEWLRDPAGGCKKPQDAPAGTVLYKAPMKEVVMTFISGCPVGPYAEPEATESLQLVNPTLDSAPVPFLPLSDEELGIEVDRAIWADFLSFPNREPDISNLQDVNIPNQEFNFSNEELNSSNLQDANSSNGELNFSAHTHRPSATTLSNARLPTCPATTSPNASTLVAPSPSAIAATTISTNPAPIPASSAARATAPS